MSKFDPSNEEEQRIQEMLLSTGNVNRSYVVRDVVFVAEKMEADLFQPGIDPNELMQDIKLKLKQQAHAYNADAVINCNFDTHHVTIDDKTFVEIFAYGTVVQFIQGTIGG